MVIELRSPDEIDALAVTGSAVSAVLSGLGEHVVAGVALAELDEIAREVAAGAGARPVGGAVISASVNDEILGGVPDGRVLVPGDLLSVACALEVGGWFARAATSWTAGTGHEGDRRLIEATRLALADGVAAARPGARLGEVCRAVGLVGRSAGFGVPPVGGCGVGRQPRQEPQVPNDGHPARGMPLRPGLVFSVEPIFTASGHDHLDSESSVVRTGDEGRAAHSGHTIAITENGARVLT
ncbi:M24 family metallopeptidase [Saccharopolyspora dendranthemae]|uniref:Methionyl aminopeptidase n=1 Tax=Saccharopolyspora dendranthemae TaxID=1181886 RepID=A0A561U9C4_9PSEU|nr:M24 family metallopeptidase [Saccharopolyspora dendranthemae]TWF95958.1 methionyl aminopeptidase [Saccharopolyspora dendranthemae]